MSNRLKKKNKKSKNRNFEPISFLNVSRYTYDVWMDSYPNSNKKEWENCACPKSTISFLLNAIDNMGYAGEMPQGPDGRYPKMHIIPLDNEFLLWLKVHGYENTQTARLEYTQKYVDEDKAFQLMQKNGWDVEYELMGLPVYIFTDSSNPATETQYKLPENTRLILFEFFEKYYGKDNVFLPGYVLRQADYYNEPEMMLNMADAYFKDGINIKYGKWEDQQYVKEEMSLYQLIIPFVIKHCHTASVFDIDELMEDIFKNFDLNIFLDQEWLNKNNKKDINDEECPESSETELALMEYFGENAIMHPYTIMWEDILEENELFIERINNFFSSYEKESDET